MFTDQALEQEIKKLKGQGGMVGLSRDEGALDCLVTTVPHLAAVVGQYLDSFLKNSRSSGRKKHKHPQGNIAVRSQTISQKLQHLIELHYGCNPFDERTLLKNLVSLALALKRPKMIFYSLQEFDSECLKLTSKLSVWDKMKIKKESKPFFNWMDKKKVQVGDKVIKLQEEFNA